MKQEKYIKEIIETIDSKKKCFLLDDKWKPIFL